MLTDRTMKLLTDEQMRTFLEQGFLILQTGLSKAFHTKLTERLSEVYQEEGNPGNNLLPRVRELRQVFEHQVITGALTSVLGPDYMLHAHRHGHYNAAATAGGWHKDSYWGYNKLRHHHPWWAMIMYFPQDTPVELGPTGIMPGTQHHEGCNFDTEDAREALASGEAGTFALIHYDIWHRATPNVLGQPRYMLKFEFMRTQAPERPSWDCQDPAWRPLEDVKDTPAFRHEALCEEQWHWLSGRIGGLAGSVQADAATLERLEQTLHGKEEPAALDAAYELARCGAPGIAVLGRALALDRTRVSRLGAYGLSAAGTDAAEVLTAQLDDARPHVLAHAVFALGELRAAAAPAMPQLLALLDHPKVEVRYGVAEALGMIATPADQAVAGLIRCLQDDAAQVRFTAGLALCRIGRPAEAAIPQLALCLEDDNRYVRAHAAEALRYIGTEQAKDVLIQSLFYSRWCDTTTPANTFYP